MNYSLKQLVLPVVLLMPVLSTEVVGDSCPPSVASNGEVQTALTVCQGSTSSGYTLNFPGLVWEYSDSLFDTKLDFQIRSCGDFSCNRATFFSLHSHWDGGGERKINLVNGESIIPLSVVARQTKTSKFIQLPLEKSQADMCREDLNQCQFDGSGLKRTGNNTDDCPNCVNFQLHLTANLKELINNKVLNNSGWHTATFTMGIQQHWTSVNDYEVDDGGHKADVKVTISIFVPDLIQISGLKDIGLSQKNLVGDFYEGSREFCVWRLGGQKFSIEASGKQDISGYFRLISDDNLELGKSIFYRMFIGRTGGNEPIRIYGTPNKYSETDWKGDCNSFGENINGETNMSLKIKIPKGNVDGKPSGVYKDTMTLTVQPD